MRTLSLDVVATRGGLVESRHRVHAAVVGADDRLAAAAGDPGEVTFWRSCAKPFQVMPLLASGGFDRAGWGDDQLALACASHGGEPEHVALAAAMLASLGLEEGDLACGPHEPLSRARRATVARVGIRAAPAQQLLGQARAMLARAVAEGWRTRGTSGRPPGAARLHGERGALVRAWPRRASRGGVDGCGVVVYALPLEAMARAFGRLAARRGGDGRAGRVCTRCAPARSSSGGTDRFDTVLMEETDGRVLAKVGAEGVHTVALLDQGVGAALKAEDGSPRAQFPAVLRLLQHLGALPAVLPPRLAEVAARAVRNTRGEVVGDVRAAC
jgi:L-asparaginase II